MSFLHVNAAATDTWPTGDNSSRDASRTTTQGSSHQTAGGKTRIKSIQNGPSGAAGTLLIQGYDGTTLIREVVLGTASNVANNFGSAAIEFPGGFSAHVTSGGGVDLYIDYEYAPNWV